MVAGNKVGSLVGRGEILLQNLFFFEVLLVLAASQQNVAHATSLWVHPSQCVCAQLHHSSTQYTLK